MRAMKLGLATCRRRRTPIRIRGGRLTVRSHRTGAFTAVAPPPWQDRAAGERAPAVEEARRGQAKDSLTQHRIRTRVAGDPVAAGAGAADAGGPASIKPGLLA